MVTLSPVTTSTVNVNPYREQQAVRDETAVKERLQANQSSTSSLSKTENNTQKNYRQQQDFADARLPDPTSNVNGNRRGSLLDLSV
ncbi:MAG: hypothetical protein DI586_01255 [Micavibrio aeruginosavorus]|uniref:Uncharacterized protein n=1 Tax=Micavibrio aeruginosavorus TaxID=349221 RepID=A0A2W5FMI0_9BACT|nr:MAG: hypothetical protein DI586_01255 [Micavibrio aeruginosavorus]